MRPAAYTEIVRFCASPVLKVQLEAAARAEGVTVSEYLRSLVRKWAGTEQTGKAAP